MRTGLQMSHVYVRMAQERVRQPGIIIVLQDLLVLFVIKYFVLVEMLPFLE